MKLSASIMAHPDRHEQVAELLETLDSDDVMVAWDGEGPPSGNSDRVWRTARRGWEMFDESADWHVLLQDDAIVCQDFLAGLSVALEHVPQDAVVSPYLGMGGMTGNKWLVLAAKADNVNASWVRGNKLLWGVCIAVPTRLIPQMIADCDRKTGVPDDMRVSGWFERRGADCWYTWPSLVDHRNVPSLTKHRAKDRRARRHHLGSAVELSWDGQIVTDPMITRRRGARSGPSGNRRVMSTLTRDSGSGKAGNRA
jgi:hypothetical protein